MRVDFVIIGAQKCGTTSLAAQLARHPDICFSEKKEPGYFNRVEDWEADLASYHGLFLPKDGQICGEASTMYTFLPEWQGTHARLFAYNPGLKLIYIMRQPVERVTSNYSHDLVRGLVKGPPESVVFENPVYINRSRYGVQIRPYLELFGRENLLPLILEEYSANHSRTLRLIAEFLGISADSFDDIDAVAKHRTVGEQYWRPATVRAMVNSSVFDTARNYLPASIRRAVRQRLSNRLDEAPYFSPELKRLLWLFLEDDVRSIEDLLGRRLDVWRQGDIAWSG